MVFNPQVNCHVVARPLKAGKTRPVSFMVQADITLGSFYLGSRVGTEGSDLESHERRRWVSNPRFRGNGTIPTLDTMPFVLLQPQGEVLAWHFRSAALEDELLVFEGLAENVLTTLRAQPWDHDSFMEAQYEISDWQVGFPERMSNFSIEALGAGL